MKGDEGWFLVVLSAIVCISITYTGGMKGKGFFSFRFSNFQLFEDRELFIE